MTVARPESASAWRSSSIRARTAAAESLAPALAAAWQTLFLVVPVVHVPFGAIEPLFAGLGPMPLGWLLADHAERLPARQARSILRRLDRAVLAGDTAGSGDTAHGEGSALTTDEASNDRNDLDGPDVNDASARCSLTNALPDAHGSNNTS